jgi:hypothetical protein
MLEWLNRRWRDGRTTLDYRGPSEPAPGVGIGLLLSIGLGLLIFFSICGTHVKIG